MNIQLQRIILNGNGLELTEVMKQFAQEKAAKLLRHDGRIIRVRIEVGTEFKKGRERIFTARGIVELHGPDLVASERSENAYVAVERMVNKLDRKIRHRHRRRLFKRVRPRAIDLPSGLPKVPGRIIRKSKRSGLRAA